MLSRRAPAVVYTATAETQRWSRKDCIIATTAEAEANAQRGQVGLEPEPAPVALAACADTCSKHDHSRPHYPSPNADQPSGAPLSPPRHRCHSLPVHRPALTTALDLITSPPDCAHCAACDRPSCLKSSSRRRLSALPLAARRTSCTTLARL